MLDMTPESAVGYAWLAWAVSWGLAAFWSQRAEKRPGLGSEALYRVVVVIGAVIGIGEGPPISKHCSDAGTSP